MSKFDMVAREFIPVGAVIVSPKGVEYEVTEVNHHSLLGKQLHTGDQRYLLAPHYKVRVSSMKLSHREKEMEVNQ